MPLIRSLVYRAAARRLLALRNAAADPRPAQERRFRALLAAARRTDFGRHHALAGVRTPRDWARAVPLQDYEQMAPWWARARAGEPNVTWPGRIRYWAISSGTTSGEKYIPVSPATIRSNRGGGWDCLVPALAEDAIDLAGGRLLFLGGSTTLRREGASWTGDNTGIMARHIPWWLRSWHTPGQAVAGETAWGTKIARAAALAVDQDVRMLSGVPSWILLFAEEVLRIARRRKRAAATLVDLWPHLGLYVHGGMSFAPYRRRFLELAGGTLRCTDTYSASEGGTLAVQDRRDQAGMLPLAARGTWFEFVPASELRATSPTRHLLHEVEPGVDYAVVLNTDSGIWSYVVGDVVRFVAVQPLRLVFERRIAHSLNAFGEHVSAGEIERAMLSAAATHDAEVAEYAVAARFPDATSPRGAHVWYAEFLRPPADADGILRAIDAQLCAGNEDYAAHRSSDYGLAAPEMVLVPPGGFLAWMRRRGKEGGQHKVPRVLAPSLAADLAEHVRSLKVAALPAPGEPPHPTNACASPGADRRSRDSRTAFAEG